MRSRILAWAAVLTVLTGCGGNTRRMSSSTTPSTASATTTSTGETSTSATSSFRGSVVSASGAYAGEGGRAEVSLETRGSGGARPLKLVFHSLPCQGAPQCVELDGTLTGEMAPRPGRVPDTGRSLTIRATGRLTTLGHVTATGIAQGTGFIRRGHELLELTLTSRSGRVTLRALSGAVGGFTSP